MAAVSTAYYNFIMPYGLAKFKRFAVNVWNVNPEGKSDEETAKEGIEEMRKWMKKLGLVMTLSELGVKEDMIEGIADSTLVMEGGYKILTREEISDILKKSL